MDIKFNHSIMRIAHCALRIAISFLVFSNAFATSSYSILSNWRPLIGGNLGAAISSDVGKSQDFPIQNPITDEFYDYSADNNTQGKLLYGAFVGAEKEFSQKFYLQLGFDFNQEQPFSAEGSFVQGADAQSADTYHYSYRIITRQLLAEGKLLYPVKKRWYPYLLVGLGASFNNSYHYRTDVPPLLTLTRTYSNNSTTSFSYAVGVGVDVDVISHLRLGLGYRFTDFGKASLGQGNIDGTEVSGTLTQSHLYTNEVLAQLTYIF